MKGIFERQEARKVILEMEDESYQTIDRQNVAENAREGDVLFYQPDTNCWEIDQEATQKRREKIQKMMENFWIEAP